MLNSIIKRVFEKSSTCQPETECPEAESLALYMDNKMEEKEKKQMERHLAECDACLEEIVLCSKLAKEEIGDKALREAADVVVRFLKRSIEIVSELKEITIAPTPVLAPVRGTSIVSPDVARFRKEFYDLTVEVEVKRPNGKAGEIRISAYKDKRPLNKIRVSLLCDEKELASFLTEEGQVHFEYSRMGKYLIRLTQNKLYLGEITLEFMEC